MSKDSSRCFRKMSLTHNANRSISTGPPMCFQSRSLCCVRVYLFPVWGQVRLFFEGSPLMSILIRSLFSSFLCFLSSVLVTHHPEADHRHWADQEGGGQDHRRNHFQDPERTHRGDQRKGGEYKYKLIQRVTGISQLNRCSSCRTSLLRLLRWRSRTRPQCPTSWWSQPKWPPSKKQNHIKFIIAHNIKTIICF